MEIREISKRINDINHSKGFWDRGIDVPQKLMLIVTEVAEACEADRKPVKREPDSWDLKSLLSAEEFSTQVFEDKVKDTYGDELADIAIRLFDLAYEQDIDLSLHIEAKVRYNETRSRMHGGKKY